MRNAGLEETQAGIKIAGRNINNLRYADDTILMAESARQRRRVPEGRDPTEINWPRLEGLMYLDLWPGPNK